MGRSGTAKEARVTGLRGQPFEIREQAHVARSSPFVGHDRSRQGPGARDCRPPPVNDQLAWDEVPPRQGTRDGPDLADVARGLDLGLGPVAAAGSNRPALSTAAYKARRCDRAASL